MSTKDQFRFDPLAVEDNDLIDVCPVCGYSLNEEQKTITQEDVRKAMQPLINKNLGWFQCTQCGNGQEVHRADVEAGDIIDGQVCDHCGIGPMRIDWTWPDGPGWKAEK